MQANAGFYTSVLVDDNFYLNRKSEGFRLDNIEFAGPKPAFRAGYDRFFFNNFYTSLELGVPYISTLYIGLGYKIKNNLVLFVARSGSINYYKKLLGWDLCVDIGVKYFKDNDLAYKVLLHVARPSDMIGGIGCGVEYRF